MTSYIFYYITTETLSILIFLKKLVLKITFETSFFIISYIKS